MNNKNKTRSAIAGVVLLSLGRLTAFAQTAAALVPASVPDAASNASWTMTPAVVSQYMFRGVRLGGAAFEPSLEYDNGNLAIGVWNNTPMANKVPGQSDPEFDFYGSYTFEVQKDVSSLAPGYTLYTYPNAVKGNGFYPATFEPNLAFNYSLSALKLTPKVYYDFVLKGPTFELNAAITFPLKDAGTELDFGATVGTYEWTDAAADASAAVKNWGNYWLLGVSLPFQVNKESKLTVGWAYTEGSGNYLKQGSTPKVSNRAATGRGVFTLSYAYTF
jgi:uncharacterized protein (TIGR02001 family)